MASNSVRDIEEKEIEDEVRSEELALEESGESPISVLSANNNNNKNSNKNIEQEASCEQVEVQAFEASAPEGCRRREKADCCCRLERISMSATPDFGRSHEGNMFSHSKFADQDSNATTATNATTDAYCIELADGVGHYQRSVSRMGKGQCCRENEGECCGHFDSYRRTEVPGLLSTFRERLKLKNFSAEVRSIMDVEQFVHQGDIMLNVTQVSVEEIIDAMLRKALSSEKEPDEAIREARDAIFIHGSSMLVARTIQGVRVVELQGQAANRGQLEYDQTWLCALCNLALVNRRRMILARFKQPINMGESAHEISLFMLILTPSKEKDTKQALETGRTFSTMFTDREFKYKLLAARNETEFKSLMMLKAHQMSESRSLKNRYKYKLDPAVQLSISSSISNFLSNDTSTQTSKHLMSNSNKQASGDLSSKLEHTESGEIDAANLNEDQHNRELSKKNNYNADEADDRNPSGGSAIVFSKNPRASKLFELLAQASQVKQSESSRLSLGIEGIDPTLFDNNTDNICNKRESSCLGSLCSQIKFGKDLLDDLRRRLRYYTSDYKDAFVGPPKTIQKTVATIWFLYFGILLPTIAFSVLNRLQTHGYMGDLRKALIGQALGGLGFALLGGQPLVIIMTTAPLCLYTKVIHQMCLDYGFPFPAMYAAVGLWNGLFLAIYSLFGFSKLMKWCTRSTEEVFALFIVIAFISDAGKELAKSFHNFYYSPQCMALDAIIDGGKGGATQIILNSTLTSINTVPICRRDTSLLFMILMFGTLWLATSLYKFNKTPYLEAGKRELLADYALPIAVIAMSFLGSFVFDDIYVQKFPEPDELSFVRAPIEHLPLAGILTAGGLGFTLSLLFFMDQNISAAMVNAPQNRLKKGCAYHLDLLVVGILNAFLTLFGLPMMHGVLPHSPLHVRSLADIEERVEEGHLCEVIANVRETRVTGVVSHLLLFLSLLLIPYPVAYIPTAVLNGLFLYMAVTSLDGLQVFERILLLFTEQSKYSPNHYIRRCPQRKIHKFTLLQLLQLVVMCLFGFSPYNIVGMFFPVIILLMIPFRHKIVPKFIEHKYLQTLDGKH